MMEIDIGSFIACIFFAALFGIIVAALVAGRKRKGIIRWVVEMKRALDEERKKNFELENKLLWVDVISQKDREGGRIPQV